MDQIDRAIQVLNHDGLVVYPTETVYGLGADALSDEAIRSVYDSKHRPFSEPISIAVADLEMLAAVAHLTPLAEEFVERFLAGPVHDPGREPVRSSPVSSTAGPGSSGSGCRPTRSRSSS